MAAPDRETTARWFQAHLIHRADERLTAEDWAGMADQFAPDAEYLEASYGQHRGREAIRKFLRRSMSGLEGWRFVLDWTEVGEGRVVVQLRNRAPGQRRDGSFYEFVSVTVVEYDDQGRIRRQLDLYDRWSAVRTFLASKLGGG